MGLRLDKLIASAVKDGKITSKEADQLVAHVKKDGTVSATEKRQLQALLARAGTQFDQGVREKLMQVLGGTRPPVTAEEILAAKLKSSEEGGFTGSELAQAEAAVAEKYGPQVAKETLTKALGARTGDITIDGVTWLQQNHGRMDGQITRFQNVLQTHLKDAKLLDANFDGKLDENDKIFTVDAAGKVNVQNIGEVLRDRVRIGAAMVGACEDMNAAHHKFALIKDHTFNPDFWVADGGGSFTLKPGVKPADAVKDIFANPDKYKFECATALVIVYYKAMVDLLGPNDFNTIAPDLRIGPWDYEDDLAKHLDQEGSSWTEASDEQKGKLRAGDYTYFRNWDVSPDGAARGWQGENVISLGNGLYYGHPFGIATGEHIVDYLNQNRNPGSTRSASMLELQRRLNSLVLKLDKVPG